MNLHLNLFLTFAYIGATNFGGGITMMPMFRHMLVGKRQWLTEEEMSDIFSISQCLPGIIASNTAVFVGHKKAGVSGGICAALGMITPSVVFILLIASFITALADVPIAAHAFAGLRVCVSVLIITAVVKLWKVAIVDKIALVIFIVVFLAAVLTSIPIALLIIAAGIFGVAITSVKKMKKE